MKYLIVKIDKSTYALCKDGYTYSGEGNFSGWYAIEALLNCDVIFAINVKEFEDSYILFYKQGPESTHVEKLPIVSIYQSKKIEAQSDEEAVELCKGFVSDLLDNKRDWIENMKIEE